jgi:hypothetical protein
VIMTAYGSDGRTLSPGRGRDFSLSHHVQTGSGAHPDSYALVTGTLSADNMATQ